MRLACHERVSELCNPGFQLGDHPGAKLDQASRPGPLLRFWLLMSGFSFWLFFLLFVYVLFSTRRLKDSERMVVFHKGKAVRVVAPGMEISPGLVVGRGLVVVCLFIEKGVRVDMAPRTLPLPAVTFGEGGNSLVSGTYTYHVHDAMQAVTNTFDAHQATSERMRTSLNWILSRATIKESIGDLSGLRKRIIDHANSGTNTWGVTVTEVTLTNLALPLQVLRMIGAAPQYIARGLALATTRVPGKSESADALEPVMIDQICATSLVLQGEEDSVGAIGASSKD